MLARLKYKNKSCVVSLPLNSLLYAALYDQFQLIDSILQTGNYFHILIDDIEINPDLPVSTLLNVKLFTISTNIPKSLSLKHLHSSKSKPFHIKRIWQDTIKSATYLIHGTASPFLALSLEATDSIWNDLINGNINENKWIR
ncbi:hypothetical protein CANINC_002947 [Pichia inconspicua]|uniref:Autophagy protein ATG5 alpha-helical bundle region domain-containing protein n=1 Tax=Pichia inconspicua TaxID=52247 RepID=A0A4T0WZU9_9ASCO|nr:hypothetical protein CANINC_002947 [[Candida] inconspicua]